MKNKRLQSAIIDKEQLVNIKGGYVHVSGAAEAAGFIGTAVDIRLVKEDVTRSRGVSNNLNVMLR